MWLPKKRSKVNGSDDIISDIILQFAHVRDNFQNFSVSVEVVAIITTQLYRVFHKDTTKLSG